MLMNKYDIIQNYYLFFQNNFSIEYLCKNIIIDSHP